MPSRIFWTDLLERVVAAFCQGFLGVIGVTAVSAVTGWPWAAAASVGAAAAIVALFTGLASLGVHNNTASLLPGRYTVQAKTREHEHDPHMV
jgi:hypothetical protein